MNFARPISLLMLGCMSLALMGFAPSVPRQALDSDKTYRRDIALDVNGFEGEGVLVAKRAKRYVIKGESKSKLDLLTLTTCHRDFKAERLKNSFEYVYEPISGIEDTGACPMQISAYDMRGVHSWALIEFEDASAALPARVKCNGTDRQYGGVSICQSREGLTQEISFESAVMVAPEPECPMPMPTDKKTFVFSIAPRECVYAFMSEHGKIHRLTTIGFQGTILRGE